MLTFTTQSGRTFEVKDDFYQPERIVGLDPDGRIVVDTFNVLTSETPSSRDFVFGLTLCHQASDKGYEDGIYCRACGGAGPNADAGNYLYRAPDGTFPGLDPIVAI